MAILVTLLEFLTVLVASFKGLSMGDKWFSQYIAAIKENTAELKKYNERPSQTQGSKDKDE